jgi:sulfonate transport system substrate-binding protein
MKTPLLVIVLVAGLVGCGASAAGSPDSHAPVTLRFGDQQQSVQTLLAASGQDAGLAYRLEWFDFNDGPHMNAAFAADRIDAGYMGDTPAIFAGAAHDDVSVVATAVSAGTSESFYQLVARSGTGITSLADLRHRKVAVTGATALEGYLDELLATVNLAEKDVTIVNVPLTSLTATLESGSADAAISYEPSTSSYLGANPGAAVVPVPAIPVYLVDLAANSALRDRGKRAAIQDLVGRLTRAEAWALANPSAWAQAYYVAHFHVPLALGLKIYTASGEYRYEGVADSGLEAHMKAQAALLQQSHQLPPGDNVSTLFGAP